MINSASSLLQILNLTLLSVQQLLRKIGCHRRPVWFFFFFPKHINLRTTTSNFQFHLVVVDFFTELSAEKHTSCCLRNQGKI